MEQINFSAVGVWTGRNVGIATTARSSVALYVDGDTTITGDEIMLLVICLMMR